MNRAANPITRSFQVQRIRKLAITVEPLRELTASQRRQLDKAGLVSAVTEATATLTVGTVTVARTRVSEPTKGLAHARGVGSSPAETEPIAAEPRTSVLRREGIETRSEYPSLYRYDHHVGP